MQYRDGFNKRANGNFSRIELYGDNYDNTAQVYFYIDEPSILVNVFDKYVKDGVRLLQQLAPVKILSKRFSSGDSPCIYLQVKFLGDIDAGAAKSLNIDMIWDG